MWCVKADLVQFAPALPRPLYRASSGSPRAPLYVRQLKNDARLAQVVEAQGHDNGGDARAHNGKEHNGAQVGEEAVALQRVPGQGR